MYRATENPPSQRTRWIALYVLCAGVLMIVLDATIVNVALPSIKRSLGFSENSLAWVVNAYLIAFGGLLLLAGRLGDLIGQRRVFLIGLTVFTSASILCALAPSQGLLIAGRFIQGAGGALTSAVILGMIVTMFPEPRDQAKAIGVYGFVATAGGSVGLLAGGVLTQGINWHWIFFINIPIGVATLIVAPRLLPKDKGTGFSKGTDGLGAVLITAALMLGVYTIVKPAAEDGWGSPVTLSFGGGAIALLIAFVIREAVASNPLIPLRIFRSRTVSGANAVQMLAVAGMFGMFVLGVLYLQDVLHYDALETGLAFLPTTIVIGTLSLRYTERLITRFGPRATLLPGLVLIAVGLALFGRAPVHGSYLFDVLPAIVPIGVGVGIAFPTLATLAMSGAAEKDAGLASGLVNTTMQVGSALGLALLATLSATRSASLAAAGVDKTQALDAGYQLGFLIGAGFVVIALIVAILTIRPRAQR